MTELSVLQYAQFHSLASKDSCTDIEHVLRTSTLWHSRNEFSPVSISPQADLMIRCDDLRRTFSTLRNENPLEATTVALEMINSATSTMSDKDYSVNLNSIPPQQARFQKLPLPFLTIGGGNADRDAGLVRKSSNRSGLHEIENRKPTTNKVSGTAKIELEWRMNTAHELISTAVSRTRLSLSFRAMKMLSYNEEYDLHKELHANEIRSPICLRDDTDHAFEPTSFAFLQATSSPLARHAMFSDFQSQELLTEVEPGKDVVSQSDPVISTQIDLDEERLQLGCAKSAKARKPGVNDSEVVTELKGPPTKKAKHHHISTVQSDWTPSKHTPSSGQAGGHINAQDWLTNGTSIEKPHDRRTLASVQDEREVDSRARTIPDRIPLTQVEATFVAPDIEMNALVDRCVAASPQLDTSCKGWVERILLTARHDEVVSKLLSKESQARSILLESATQQPQRNPRSQDLLWREPGIQILNISEPEFDCTKLSDTDESEASANWDTDEMRSLMAQDWIGKPPLDTKFTQTNNDQASPIQPKEVLGSKSPLFSNRRIESNPALHGDSTLSPHFTPRTKKIYTQSSQPQSGNESLLGHKADYDKEFCTSSSLSNFLDLRGNQFRARAHLEKHEVVNNPVESTQQSLHEKDRTAQRGATIGTRAHTKPVYTPSITPLQDRRVILINNSLLQNKPLLIQFLDHQGGSDLTMIYRDFDQSQTHHADILLEPNKCIIFSHTQALEQRPLPGQKSLSGLSPAHDRIMRLCSSFKTIFVLVYFVLECSSTQTQRQFTRFCQHLARYHHREMVPIWVPCSKVSDVPDNINAWTWKVINQNACKQSARSAAGLIQDETQWELFLRKAGINAFAAQVVLSSLKSVNIPNGSQKSTGSGLRRLLQLTEADLVKVFGRITDGDTLHKFYNLMHC